MPAAAVIPAPVAYIKVVAVKKLVVGFQIVFYFVRITSIAKNGRLSFSVLALLQFLRFYFEEIKAFQAGLCREYVSME